MEKKQKNQNRCSVELNCNTSNVSCYNLISPLCLHPWKHIWSIVWVSSNGVWWRWHPGQASSSWPGVPCHRYPAHPPASPRERSPSARTWTFTMLYEWICINNPGEHLTRVREGSTWINHWLKVRNLTGKALTLVGQWVPQASWMFCGCEGTCPKPWLLEHSYHWWPTSQTPRL